jgi:ACS family hexuronate transporter-like MFS transporter
MVAVPLSITIYARAGWRAAFLGTALAGLAWIPLWLVATRSAAARAALETEDHPAPSSPAATPPPSRLTLLITPAVARAVMLVIFVAPGIMFGLNWESRYLADAYGMSQGALASYIWVPPLLFDLGSVTFGGLASRADRRARAVRSHGGLVTAASLLAAVMAAVPFVHGAWPATLLCAVSLAGGGGLFAMLTADMLARVHPAHVSTAAGLTAAAQSLAYVIANPVIGQRVDASHSYVAVLVALGGMVLPAMVAWRLWPMQAADGAPLGEARPEG